MLVTFNPSTNRTNQAKRVQNFGVDPRHITTKGSYRKAVHIIDNLPTYHEDIFKAIEKDPEAAITKGGLIDKLIAAKVQTLSLERAITRFRASVRTTDSSLFGKYGGKLKEIEGR